MLVNMLESILLIPCILYAERIFPPNAQALGKNGATCTDFQFSSSGKTRPDLQWAIWQGWVQYYSGGVCWDQETGRWLPLNPRGRATSCHAGPHQEGPGLIRKQRGWGGNVGRRLSHKGKAGYAGLGLASLNHFCRLWGGRAALSDLILGPWVDEGRGILAGNLRPDWRDGVVCGLDWLVCTWKAVCYP